MTVTESFGVPDIRNLVENETIEASDLLQAVQSYNEVEAMATGHKVAGGSSTSGHDHTLTNGGVLLRAPYIFNVGYTMWPFSTVTHQMADWDKEDTSEHPIMITSSLQTSLRAGLLEKPATQIIEPSSDSYDLALLAYDCYNGSPDNDHMLLDVNSPGSDPGALLKSRKQSYYYATIDHATWPGRYLVRAWGAGAPDPACVAGTAADFCYLARGSFFDTTLPAGPTGLSSVRLYGLADDRNVYDFSLWVPAGSSKLYIWLPAAAWYDLKWDGPSWISSGSNLQDGAIYSGEDYGFEIWLEEQASGVSGPFAQLILRDPDDTSEEGVLLITDDPPYVILEFDVNAESTTDRLNIFQIKMKFHGGGRGDLTNNDPEIHGINCAIWHQGIRHSSLPIIGCIVANQ